MGFEESLGDPSDPNTPELELRALATSEDEYIRAEVAANPSTPLGVLESLVRAENDSLGGDCISTSTWVRCIHGAVASNPSCSEDLLFELAGSSDESVRYGVAVNPKAPEKLLMQLLDDVDDYVPTALISSNPNLSTNLMVFIASRQDRWLYREEGGTAKSILALRKDCPIFLLELLGRNHDGDLSDWIRMNVATNLNAPAELLYELSQDLDLEVRQAVAANPSAPLKTLSQLASEDSEGTRSSVATNRSSPAELLAQLATDPHESVRRGVAGNASAPPQVLIQLTTDSDYWVRRRVAENPSTPPEVRAKLESEGI
ncbi:MAG: HEAT repeat domain-containing protein [Actinomycetes bacterium]